MQTMLERALRRAAADARLEAGRDPSILLLRDGPYGIPVVREELPGAPRQE